MIATPFTGLNLRVLYTGVPSGCSRCSKSWEHCATLPTLDTCGDEADERTQRGRESSLRFYYRERHQAKPCPVCGKRKINARSNQCKSCAAGAREARKKNTSNRSA